MTSNQDVAKTSRSFQMPKAAPDSLLAAILLSFLGTAGVFYANILAALVSGLIEGLNYSSQTAGYVASANIYGAAFGAFAAVFAVKHLPWRPTAYVSLLGMIAVDIVSTQVVLSEILIPLRFGHGLVGGFLVGIAFSVFARTKSPDRTFGMLLVNQAGLGGLGLMVLPRLVPEYGPSVLFYALMGFSFFTLLILPFIDDYPRTKSEPATGFAAKDSKDNKLMIVPLLLALLAIFMYQASNMGLAAYMIELGKSFGQTTAEISTKIGIAHWVAVFGALAVYMIGAKYGRVKPLMAGLALTLVGMGMLHWSATMPWFLVGNILVSTLWAFLIPYLLAMCAKFDAHGQMVTLSGFCSKMGLASGPLVAAFVIGEGNYSLILNLVMVGITLSALIVFMPARFLDKSAD